MNNIDNEKLKEENKRLKEVLKELCGTVNITEEGIIYFQRKTIALDKEKIEIIKEVL